MIHTYSFGNQKKGWPSAQFLLTIAKSDKKVKMTIDCLGKENEIRWFVNDCPAS